MAFKIFAGIVAGALLLIFISPVVLKLKDLALTGVVLVGAVMMIVDIWQSIRSRDD